MSSTLALDHNALSGTLPSGLSNLKALVYACFTTLGLSCALLFVLQQLVCFPCLLCASSVTMGSNALTGSIPSILPWTVLTDLDLSFNRLSGVIPNDISTWTRLASLYLINNLLTSTVPTGISKLTLLRSVACSTACLPVAP